MMQQFLLQISQSPIPVPLEILGLCQQRLHVLTVIMQKEGLKFASIMHGGTLCGDSFFSSVDAGVLCGQIGGYFTNNSEIISGEPGSGPIFIELLECTLEDTDVLNCPSFSPLGLVNCDHSFDVSIRCKGKSDLYS